MKRFLSFIAVIVFALTMSVGTVYAHPGRTDSKGGHTCRTNCAKWGLKNGQYHKHTAKKKAAKVVAKTKAKVITKKFSTSFSCAVKKTCPQMVSCAEAYFYLNTCSAKARDADKDGVPCEDICPGG